MERDRRRIGEALPRHPERRLHGGLEPVGVDREPGRPPILGVLQHRLRPLADRRGRAQIRKFIPRPKAEGPFLFHQRSLAALGMTATAVTRRDPAPSPWRARPSPASWT